MSKKAGKRIPLVDENLLTYCGGYGGHCARYLGFTAFRDAAKLLAEISDAHALRNWMPSEVKEFDYEEFRKGLEFFRSEDTWFVCKGCCKGGGGGPPNCVRKCCIEHKVNVCFECTEFPCGKVKGNSVIMARAEEYKKIGRDEWLHREAKKAEQGFEGHTGKYYKVLISDSPL